MMPNASQRGGARQLARHLLNTNDNDHVEIHSLKGFMSNKLTDALCEIHAVSKGTQCRKFMFSLSLNPPEHASVPIQAFEDAIKQVEKRLPLKDQPRAVVFHEKEGRRHCHIVWSRIDGHEMTAIDLPYYKERLMEVSRKLYLKHGWDMPQGYIKRQARDPSNYSLAEYQRAKRHGLNAYEVKESLQDAWALSDCKTSFIQALRERGFWLARGDRSPYVILDHMGEIHPLASSLGVRVKQLKERLGQAGDLQTVMQAKAIIAHEMTPTFKQHVKEAKNTYAVHSQRLVEKLEAMKAEQKAARKLLLTQQHTRWLIEQERRQQRFARGFARLWQWASGKTSRIRKQNEQDLETANQRDEAELHKLRITQLTERKKLKSRFATMKERYIDLLKDLYQDIAQYIEDEKQGVNDTQGQSEVRPRKRRKRQRVRQQQNVEPNL